MAAPRRRCPGHSGWGASHHLACRPIKSSCHLWACHLHAVLAGRAVWAALQPMGIPIPRPDPDPLPLHKGYFCAHVSPNEVGR